MSRGCHRNVAAATGPAAAHPLTSSVVANDASVMGDDETRVLLVGEDGTEPEEAAGSKDAVAGRIADRLATTLDVSG